MSFQSNPVIVDSSVFVDFFRGRDVPSFQDLLTNNRILLSAYVRLELLQGVRKEELRRLEYVLGGMEKITIQTNIFESAETILYKVKGRGLTLGIVDLMIAAEAMILDCPIYSFDKIFHKLAKWKLVSVFRPK